MATVNYTVRPGDTLWNIAEKFDTSVNDIARYNGISDVNQIYPGQVLRIATQFPVASKWYIVRQGDTLSSIADRYNTTVERLLQLNCCIYDPNRIYPGQVLLPLLIQTAFSLILPFRFPYLFMHCRRMKPYCTCSSTPPKINEPQIYPLNFGASQKYSGIKARLDHLALSQCFYSFSLHSIHHINHAPCGKRSPTALQNRQRSSAQKQ